MMTKTSHQVEKVLDMWRNEPTISENIVCWQSIPARSAQYGEMPDNLDKRLQKILALNGIDRLFTHQIDCWNAVEQGKNVVLSTGTASGKTLGFLLPILNEVIHHSDSTALLLFPTKALAQDQLKTLAAFSRDILRELSPLEIRIGLYDGDTPTSSRYGIRSKANLILTNPDMLHLGILPHHTNWARLFQNLRYVVIDEIHQYRGVFGSHVANVLRRLRRIASFYGAKPQFIFTSATIANPKELAIKLAESDVVSIGQDGSSQGPRHFLIYNPPFIHKDLGVRRSASAESVRLTGDLLANNVQTLIFTRSRRSVELLLRNLRFEQPDSANHLHGYRSGYLAEERREIERELKNGTTKVVVATNALELGVDIGEMDAIVMVSYPGSVSATRQQAGRAGRRQGSSIVVLVASGNPLDQFLVRHPEFIFERSPEQALIDPDSLLILLQHIRCASFELPFQVGESFGNVSPQLLKGLLGVLEEAGSVHQSQGKYFWTSDQYPSNEISLRSGSIQQIALHANIDDKPTMIGAVDYESSLWMVHPQAIYLHEGQSYEVTDLNLESNTANLRPVVTDFYTDPSKDVQIEKISTLKTEIVRGGEKSFGEILVTTSVTGFRRLRWFSNEIIDHTPLDLPSTQLRTTAYWLTISPETVDILRNKGAWLNDKNDYGPNWPIMKDRARSRDEFTCQICGVRENGNKHHVHHIKPFRTFDSFLHANQLENLITLCPSCHRRAEVTVRIRSGLNGLGYVLNNLSTLFVLCDISDLGAYSDPESPLSEKQPTVAIYDQIPAGIGLSQRIFDIHHDLMSNAYDLVLNCQCQDGCPGCVGPIGENGYGGKEETLAILEILSQKDGS